MSESEAMRDAADGVEHLQAAAIELIAAARAFLDVAESLVREPAVAATIVSTAASVGRAVLHGTAQPSERRDAAEPPADDGRVRRIHVS